MPEDKKFKINMMGYSKKDVYQYISELDQTYSKELRELKIENKEQKAKIRILEEENRVLKKKSTMITDALVKAEEYSRDVIEKANNSAQDIRDEIELKMQTERERLTNYRGKVNDLKAYIETMLKGLSEDLDQIDTEF